MTLAADTTEAVAGLGYVGLPLAMEYGKHLRTFGCDISEAKIEAYRWKADPTGEASEQELRAILGDNEGQVRVKAIPSAEYPTPAPSPQLQVGQLQDPAPTRHCPSGLARWFGPLHGRRTCESQP